MCGVSQWNFIYFIVTLPLQINPAPIDNWFQCLFFSLAFPLPLTRDMYGTKGTFILWSGLQTYLIFFKHMSSCAAVIYYHCLLVIIFNFLWWLFILVFEWLPQSVSLLTLTFKTGLPWWRSGWESACQCRGHGFEPCSGRIPRAAEQLGPWATTTEPARLEPVLRNKRGRDSEEARAPRWRVAPACRN